LLLLREITVTTRTAMAWRRRSPRNSAGPHRGARDSAGCRRRGRVPPRWSAVSAAAPLSGWPTARRLAWTRCSPSCDRSTPPGRCTVSLRLILRRSARGRPGHQRHLGRPQTGRSCSGRPGPPAPARRRLRHGLQSAGDGPAAPGRRARPAPANGLAMLVHQGAKALEIWSGVPADRTAPVMLRAGAGGAGSAGGIHGLTFRWSPSAMNPPHA